MMNVPGLRYGRLAYVPNTQVQEIEKAAAGLVACGEYQAQLECAITHFLRSAMIDLTPPGKYIACSVDWRKQPPLWKFWFEDSQNPTWR